jgi:hypothetical protein
LGGPDWWSSSNLSASKAYKSLKQYTPSPPPKAMSLFPTRVVVWAQIPGALPAHHHCHMRVSNAYIAGNTCPSPPPITSMWGPIMVAVWPAHGDTISCGDLLVHASYLHVAVSVSKICTSSNLFMPSWPPNTTSWLPTWTVVCPHLGQGGVPLQLGKLHDIDSKSKQYKSLHRLPPPPPPNTKSFEPIRVDVCLVRPVGMVPVVRTVCHFKSSVLKKITSFKKMLLELSLAELPPNISNFFPTAVVEWPDLQTNPLDSDLSSCSFDHI